jgi:sec-independent protein translocase protein TatA
MMIVPAFIGGLGWPEIALILLLVLIFFGPRRLPEIAEAMGKSIRKFKSATNDATREVKRELEDVERQVHKDDAPAAEPKREAPRSDDTSA